MPTLAGPVRFRILTNPKDYPPFVDFYCGKDRTEKHEVNRTVRRFYAGTLAQQQVAVVLERPTVLDVNGFPALVGVCGIATGDLQGVPGGQGSPLGAYIVAIGVDVEAQKHELEDGSRCGNALLRGALEAVETILGRGPMPYVFAKVKPTNTPSQVLFDEHGFEDMGVHSGEQVLLREPELDPAFMRPASWSQAS